MHYDYVIVGGGAGGLILAAKLGNRLKSKGPDKVLLVDQSTYHIWKPTLHEVAVGTLNPQQEGFSYNMLARINHFSFSLGELKSIDSEAKSITLNAVFDSETGEEVIPERNITFNNLILAIGSGSNLFRTPGADKYAYLLENAKDAVNFQTHLMTLFVKASYSDHKHLNIVVVGGGATGVEFSTELIEAYQEELLSVGNRLHFDLKITIIDAAQHILQNLPVKTYTQAKAILDKKGIIQITDTQVLEITKTAVKTNNPQHEEIPADACIWAAGIKASEINTTFGLSTNRLNQIEVNGQLKTQTDGIYAIGDCAACPRKEGFVPALAQAAQQEAIYLNKLFAAQEKGQTFTQNFEFHDHGSLVSLGKKQGVANLINNHFFLSGFMAKIMYTSLHISHQLNILGWWRTIFLWFARSAQSRVSGRVKLH